MVATCLLAASPAWADDLGYIDCQGHSENTVVLAKAAQTSDVVTSLHCGEQFTILLSGDFFSRIQTQDGKVGYVYSYLISHNLSSPPAAQPAAQTPVPPGSAPVQTTPSQAAPVEIVPNSVFITPMNGFENYLAAAFEKKKVPLTIVADKARAAYVITGTSEDKKAGWAKMAFMGDIHSDADASIQMIDQKTGAVVFAYAVNKKSTLHGDQTTAEACAKHLKDQLEKK